MSETSDSQWRPLTLDEARALNSADRSGPKVTVRRRRGQWTGWIVGIYASPTVTIEDEQGIRQVVVIRDPEFSDA